jgi:hypothetical protein
VRKVEAWRRSQQKEEGRNGREKLGKWAWLGQFERRRGATEVYVR